MVNLRIMAFLTFPEKLLFAERFDNYDIRILAGHRLNGVISGYYQNHDRVAAFSGFPEAFPNKMAHFPNKSQTNLEQNPGNSRNSPKDFAQLSDTR